MATIFKVVTRTEEKRLVSLGVPHFYERRGVLHPDVVIEQTADSPFQVVYQLNIPAVPPKICPNSYLYAFETYEAMRRWMQHRGKHLMVFEAETDAFIPAREECSARDYINLYQFWAGERDPKKIVLAVPPPGTVLCKTLTIHTVVWMNGEPSRPAAVSSPF